MPPTTWPDASSVREFTTEAPLMRKATVMYVAGTGRFVVVFFEGVDIHSTQAFYDWGRATDAMRVWIS